jgi:ArsR family transcriptional regulator, arsenate/arsenite/antimonite-responsive transcriptional repressor
MITEPLKTDYTEDEKLIAMYSKAMGHPARIAILNYLASLDCCFFGDIFEVLPIAKATVSQHLTELKNAGLIQGTIESPKVKYCVNVENWIKAKKVFDQFFSQCCSKQINCK